MDKLAELINYLEEKYEQPISFDEYLIKRYGELKNADEPVQEEVFINLEAEGDKPLVESMTNDKETTEEEIKSKFLFFQSDKEYNKNILEQLLDSILKFRKRFLQEDEDDCVGKILDKYVNKLKKLEESDHIDDGEKIAEKYVKILKGTLMTLVHSGKYLPILQNYFQYNRIFTEEFKIGHKLSDEEFELLDIELTSILSIKAKNPEDRFRVIEMRYPIIKIYYEDEEDGELYYKLVPGVCKYTI